MDTAVESILLRVYWDIGVHVRDWTEFIRFSCVLRQTVAICCQHKTIIAEHTMRLLLSLLLILFCCGYRSAAVTRRVLDVIRCWRFTAITMLMTETLFAYSAANILKFALECFSLPCRVDEAERQKGTFATTQTSNCFAQHCHHTPSFGRFKYLLSTLAVSSPLRSTRDTARPAKAVAGFQKTVTSLPPNLSSVGEGRRTRSSVHVW